MGRSRPTFRNYLDAMEGDWQPYRRTLRRRDQPHFDALFAKARGHADAAGQLDPADPRLAVLFSMLLAQERELAALRERAEGMEAAADGDDTGAAVDDGAGEAAVTAGAAGDGSEG